MNTDRKICTVCGAATAEKEHVCTPASTVNESSVPTIRVGSGGTRQAPGPAKAGPKPDPTTAGRRKADVPPPNLDELQKVSQKVVNQYVLCDVLGQGGMGQVWKAWDTKLARW